MIDISLSPLERFVDAVARRDYAALEATLAPNVRFRALVPPGFREAVTAAGAREHIEGWFEDLEAIEMVERRLDPIGAVAQACYRLRVRYGDAPYVMQQTVLASTGEAGIEELDMLCSGIRAE